MSPSASRHGHTTPHGAAAPLTRRSLFALTAAGVAAGQTSAGAAPQGQLTYGVHVSLTWFDPGEAAGIITPYMLLYGLHDDAVLKAMPDGNLAPSLAESYAASEDGLTYDFVLRQPDKPAAVRRGPSGLGGRMTRSHIGLADGQAAPGHAKDNGVALP